MAEITASMVKELREQTGAGMMDCKAALNETGGDLEAAVVHLRKIMGSKLTRREGRTAAEGVIAVTVIDNQDAAIIELNSETDFVARSEDFKALAKQLVEQVARYKGHSVETVMAQDSHSGEGTVQERFHDVFTKLRENIIFKRFEFISTDANGAVAAYVHVPANDKIGVLVELETGSPEAAGSEAIQNLGRELAMQIAASRPRFQSREDVKQETIDQERDIARTQAKNENKPEGAIEKIVEGRLKKFYEETVLLDQPWLREPKKTVGQVIKEAGASVSLRRFVRYEIGENVTGVASSGEIKEQAE